MGLIVLVKTASVVFGLTNVAVIPETFGKSRTIKAAALIGVLGILVSLVIKGTVIATWKTHDPSTWNLAFRDGRRVHGRSWPSSCSSSCARRPRRGRWPSATRKTRARAVARRAGRHHGGPQRPGARHRDPRVLGGAQRHGLSGHRLLPEGPARRGERRRPSPAG